MRDAVSVLDSPEANVTSRVASQLNLNLRNSQHRRLKQPQLYCSSRNSSALTMRSSCRSIYLYNNYFNSLLNLRWIISEVYKCVHNLCSANCVIHVRALIIIKDSTNIIIYNLELKYYNSNLFRLSSGHLQGVGNYTKISYIYIYI